MYVDGWCPGEVIVPYYSTNATSSVGNINRLWFLRSQSTGTICTSICTSVMGGAWTTPDAYVFIHRLIHRLGYRIGNHRQFPFVPAKWVTDMPTCNASQTCRVWLWESHWKALAMHNKHGYSCSARQPVWVLQRLCILALPVQGKCGHWDTTQKLISNGKDLHILIVISIEIVTARRWYLSFLLSMGKVMD